MQSATMATFLSWIAPTPLLRINKRNTLWIVLFVTTKLWQWLLIGTLVWKCMDMPVEDYPPFITGAIVWNICSCINFGALVFLADYYSISKLSTFCCFCDPFVHKSIVFRYLEKPLIFNNDQELDGRFPAFLRIFLNDKSQQFNCPGDYYLIQSSLPCYDNWTHWAIL